ncbi:MAG: hypothetical protein NUV46_04195 [Nanoarchaeota archaeon]|nr:hypothetical protein [Nanoarchaeota archaeon]
MANQTNLLENEIKETAHLIKLGKLENSMKKINEMRFTLVQEGNNLNKEDYTLLSSKIDNLNQICQNKYEMRKRADEESYYCPTFW